MDCYIMEFIIDAINLIIEGILTGLKAIMLFLLLFKRYNWVLGKILMLY